jgi:hypothetical protein
VNYHRGYSLFDRFIDQFSARDLRSRVWFVIAIGFALIAVAVAAGWWLLSHPFFVADKPGLESVKFLKLLIGRYAP